VEFPHWGILENVHCVYHRHQVFGSLPFSSESWSSRDSSELSELPRPACGNESHQVEFYDEIYFVGIIDSLTKYTMRKKIAHLLKTFWWERKSLSTVEPKYYARRFLHFVETHLVE